MRWWGEKRSSCGTSPHRNHLRPFQTLADEAGTHLAETSLVIAHDKPMLDRPAVGRGEAARLEHPGQLARRLLSAVDQRYSWSHDPLQQRLEQRIVGAAEHEGIHRGLTKRLEILAGDEFGRGAIEPTF